MKKSYIFIFLSIIILVLSSCRKKIEQTGSFSGTVYLYDALDTNKFLHYFIYSYPYHYGHEGITVKLIKNKKESYETTTDNNGYFRFDEITSGTYKLIIEKDGYWTYEKDDYVITGGGEQHLKNTEFAYPYDFIILWPKREKVTGTLNVIVKNDSVKFSTDLTIHSKDVCYFLLSKKKNFDVKTAIDFYTAYSWNASPQYSLDLLRHFFVFDKGDTIYWQAYYFKVKVQFWYNYDSEVFPLIAKVETDSNYFKFYGLSETPNKSGYFVVPSTFEAKLPEGIAYPEDKKEFEKQIFLNF